MSKKDFDPTKPFSVMIYDKEGVFGIVCGRDGSIDCAESQAEHKLRRLKTMTETTSRGGTWVNSAALFAMAFQFDAITVESVEHIESLMGEPPYSLSTIRHVAGNGYVLNVEKEPFIELLKDATDISFG